MSVAIFKCQSFLVDEVMHPLCFRSFRTYLKYCCPLEMMETATAQPSKKFLKNSVPKGYCVKGIFYLSICLSVHLSFNYHLAVYICRRYRQQ